MATILQPLAPWMRDLSRFMNTPGAASAFLPPADVLVSEDGVTVYMDVPGCTARVERSFGAFERTLRVTDGLDPEGIEASMSDGVLMMRLPEPVQTQPRRIQIRPHTATGNGAGMQAETEGGPEGAPGDCAPATGEMPEGAAAAVSPPFTHHAGGPEDRV
jgi:HSP20 family molecular chaperone IbpA